MQTKNIFTNVFSDNTSGSATLLQKIKELAADYLNQADPDSIRLQKDLTEAAHQLKDFAIIIHFIYYFVNELGKNKEKNKLLEFIKNYSDQWSAGTAIKQFSEEIPLQNKTVLIHSNSRTIQEILLNYRGPIDGLYLVQTYSSPAGEGLAQAEALSENGFNVTLIHENNAWNHAGNIAVYLFGADRIEEERFLNKAGTAQLCLMARHFNQPAYVVADARKKAMKDFYTFLGIPYPESIDEKAPQELSGKTKRKFEVNNQYFEWIPNHLITKFYS